MLFHKELGLLISVYVDDFKLAGPRLNIEKGWSLITQLLELDPPQPLNLYLGCIHEKRTLKVEWGYCGRHGIQHGRFPQLVTRRV
jgi:hypothetical protein